MDKIGIYIVDVDGDGASVRSLVLARNAEEAASHFEREGVKVEVGRIGTYDPGITGAQMTASAGMGEAVVAEFLR